jgi:hypothetical protein
MQRTEGQAVVLAALAFVVMIGALGLALDGANAYNQRRNANNAADAAAMAGTRVLLDGNKSGSGENRDVYQAVQTYLDNHLPASSGTLTWNAYYIDRNGNQIGGAIPNNSGAVEVVDMQDATKVRGISVDVKFTFRTFFMPLLGRNDLTVAGYGLGLVGPLGGATGPDLVPLAIRDEEASRWQRSSASDKSQNWSLMVYTDTVGLTPPRTIRQYDLKQVALEPTGATPAFGTNSSSCSGVATADTLVYWWCKGTPHTINTKPEYITTSSMPPSNQLKDEIQWRISNRPDVLLPVYNRVDSTQARLSGFLAVKLTSLSASGVLKGTIIDYYLAPGPISGESSGFFDTYAINLVR